RSNEPRAFHLLAMQYGLLNHLGLGCVKPLGEVQADRFLDSLGRAHAGLAEKLYARETCQASNLTSRVVFGRARQETPASLSQLQYKERSSRIRKKSNWRRKYSNRNPSPS